MRPCSSSVPIIRIAFKSAVQKTKPDPNASNSQMTSEIPKDTEPGKPRKIMTAKIIVNAEVANNDNINAFLGFTLSAKIPPGM